MEKVTPSMKRSEVEIREEMLSKGAFLFDFEALTVVDDKDAYKCYIDQWKTMERKGFLVTTDGCILPYSYYRKSCKGDKLKGHQRAAHFFFGRKPDYTKRVNHYGWPCDEQISHLCHRVDCIRPDHLVMEPRWKNLKRNFCGEHGACDCGAAVKCVRTYHNPETFTDTFAVEQRKDSMLELLKPLNLRFSFKLESKTKYTAEDVKKKNRNKRKKAAKEHKKQQMKKFAKFEGKQEQ